MLKGLFLVALVGVCYTAPTPTCHTFSTGLCPGDRDCQCTLESSCAKLRHPGLSTEPEITPDSPIVNPAASTKCAQRGGLCRVVNHGNCPHGTNCLDNTGVPCSKDSAVYQSDGHQFKLSAWQARCTSSKIVEVSDDFTTTTGVTLIQTVNIPITGRLNSLGALLYYDVPKPAVIALYDADFNLELNVTVTPKKPTTSKHHWASAFSYASGHLLHNGTYYLTWSIPPGLASIYWWMPGTKCIPPNSEWDWAAEWISPSWGMNPPQTLKGSFHTGGDPKHPSYKPIAPVFTYAMTPL